MDTILSLLAGSQNILLIIGTAIIGLITVFFGGRVSGANRERDKQRAKEADAYEKHLQDIGSAAGAGRADRLPDVSSDPHNRDTKR